MNFFSTKIRPTVNNCIDYYIKQIQSVAGIVKQ